MKKITTFAFLLWIASLCRAQSPYEALIQQGKAQLQAGNSVQALATGQQAIQLDGNRWEAYALAGGALMNLKRYDEAIDDFSKAIDHAPADKQQALRDLRKQCVLAESGAPPAPTQATTQVAPQPPLATQAEIVMWESIKSSQQMEDFKVYLGQYPNGTFAGLAKQRLADLQAQEQEVEAEQVARLSWVDPTTGIMWQRPLKQDEGGQLSFSEASDKCTNLQLLQWKGWRLPTALEVDTVWQRNQKVLTERIVARKSAPSWGLWTSTAGKAAGEHIVVNMENGDQLSMKDTKSANLNGYPGGHHAAASLTVQALCVRDANGAQGR